MGFGFPRRGLCRGAHGLAQHAGEIEPFGAGEARERVVEETAPAQVLVEKRAHRVADPPVRGEILRRAAAGPQETGIRDACRPGAREPYDARVAERVQVPPREL